MGNKILSYKQVHSTLGCKKKLAKHSMNQHDNCFKIHIQKHTKTWEWVRTWWTVDLDEQ